MPISDFCKVIVCIVVEMSVPGQVLHPIVESGSCPDVPVLTVCDAVLSPALASVGSA